MLQRENTDPLDSPFPLNYGNLSSLFCKRHRASFLKVFSFIHSVNVQKIAEIGVFKGKNAKELRRLFPKAQLFLIDPWHADKDYLSKGGAISSSQEIYDEAFFQVQLLFKGDPLTTIIRKPATIAAPLIPNHLDLVFIDANHHHSFVKKHIETYLPKLSSRAILSGHNYHHNRLTGVKKAVDALLGPMHHPGQDHVWAQLIDR